jgi:molecular chaperone GrpE
MTEENHESAATGEIPPTGIDILEGRIAELEQMLGAAKDEQIRLIAEMDNQRKRAARDVDSARKYGAERLLIDLLPVIDSLEAGLSQGGGDANKLREGMELTLRVLMKTVEANGVSPVNPLGDAFNPEFHQAVATVESTEVPPGSVVSVFQKGFRLNERLVRPAMVTVAKDA